MKTKPTTVFVAILLFITLAPVNGQTGLPLTLTEIMFNSPASSSNSEFIEIYNTSSTDSFDLSGFKIKYYTSTADIITNSGVGTILGPGEFAVIFENDYDLPAGIYSGSIPPDALILKISDNAFGSSGMANTTDRNIQLLNSFDQLLEEYNYSASGNSAGISDEKIILIKDNNESNWANSIRLNGTPGGGNSVSPRIHDLGITEISHLPLSPYSGDNVEVTALIKNFGTSTALVYSLKFYIDENEDGIGQYGEIIDSLCLAGLEPSDSIFISTTILNVQSGNYKIIAEIEFLSDEDLSNNIGYDEFFAAPMPNQASDVIINELMYAPGNEEPEWIELYNRTESPINLRRWKISDNSTSVFISNDALWISPDDYIVISDDSTISNYYNIPVQVSIINLPSLNNTGDNITLKDSLNTDIDNVDYLSSWGGNGGKSLERKLADSSSNDPENWGSSTAPENGTPGLKNSIVPKNHDLAVVRLSVDPQAPAYGDDAILTTTVKNIGLQAAGSYSIEIFNDANRDSIGQINEKIDIQNFSNLASADSISLLTIIHDVSTGQYSIISVINYAPDENTTNNTGFINFNVSPPPNQYNDIVINEIMYMPSSGEPEWIELYNNTADPINLKGWRISDNSSPAVISQINVFIPPGGYIVISEEDAVSNFYNIPSQVIVANLPSLNNSGDNIKLLDSLHAAIDSVNYSASWGGNSGGKSLERKLPDGASNVASNWGTCRADEKATPGKENSIKPKLYDLAAPLMAAFPNPAIYGRQISVEIIISNIGLTNADVYFARLYNDLNHDSLGQPEESIGFKQLQNLNVNQSVSVFFILPDLDTGIHNLIGSVDFHNDMNPVNNNAYTRLIITPVPDQYNDIVINEIMYDPKTSEPEWIELYNRSNKSINMKGWRIRDLSSSGIIAGNDLIFQPQTYLVLTDDGSINNFYDIPSQIAVINLPSLNNGGDTVILRDSLNRGIDSVAYLSGWGGGGGFSLERKSVGGKSNDPSNWGTSLNDEGGTPGSHNSILPKQRNLSIEYINHTPLFPVEGDNADIFIIITNSGMLQALAFTVKLFHDVNYDSTWQLEELLFAGDFFNLISGDTLVVQTQLSNLSAGNYKLISEVSFEGDEFPYDNKYFTDIYVSPKPSEYNCIVINEIMYSPKNNEPEWIEIYNRSSKAIDLKNWKLADASSNAVISDSSFFISSGMYVVLSDDESIINYYQIDSPVIVFNLPSLNNGGDDIALFDLSGGIIDAASYIPSWGGGNGISLEKINFNYPSSDSSNWGSCAYNDGATPGILNSIFPAEYDLSFTEFSLERDTALVGGSVHTFSIVKNTGLNVLSNSLLKIYRDKNLNGIIEDFDEFLYSSEIQNIAPGNEIEIGYDITNYDVGPNKYIAKIENAEDLKPGNNIAFVDLTGIIDPGEPADLVISEFMYAPPAGQPEWLEIYYNPSINMEYNQPIDLFGLKIGDQNNLSTVISTTTLLQPGEFFVIAKDSSIYDFFEINSNIAISDFPSLNNNGDRIILLDCIDRALDSLNYLSSWGGNNGKSLERINFNVSSDSQSNWGTSISINGATPGMPNSLSLKNHDLSVEKIFFNPPIPHAGDNIHISAKIKNKGLMTSVSYINLYEDTNLDGAYESLLETSPEFQLLPSTDLIFTFKQDIVNLQSERSFGIEIPFSVDEDLSDNYLTASISPGGEKLSILINEIMYGPQNDEPEWIEIYNNSGRIINLKNWEVSDILPTPKKTNISDKNINVPPRGFIVISADSSILQYHSSITSGIIITNFAGLNNSGDGVVIYDDSGETIDSVFYSSSWGGADGFSLERISAELSSNEPANWGSSVDNEKSTPGRTNSLSRLNNDVSAISITTSPIFPGTGESVYITAGIKNNGFENASGCTLRIYLEVAPGNIQLLSEVQNISLKANKIKYFKSVDSFILDQTTKVSAEIIYPVDENPSNNILKISVYPGFKRNAVLINEFMYDPSGGGPEWIEFFNDSGFDINIKDWYIGDLLSSPAKNKICIDDFIIGNGQYFVATSDTVLFKKAFANDINLFEVNLGSLGNSSDCIMIFDQRGAVIDSLRYCSDWGGGEGHSLERIFRDGLSSDSLNWFPSLDVNKATPGKLNSVAGLPEYKNLDLVINEIMFDPDQSNSEFIELYNMSDNYIEIGGWSFEDDKGRKHMLSKNKKEIPPHQYFVAAADSSILSNYNWLGENSNINILNKSTLGLSNDGGQIIIKDFRGNLIDSLLYSAGWHNTNINFTKNRSLERISPCLLSSEHSNWSSCVSDKGATPGIQNSIFTDMLSNPARFSVSPNPFSPDNDGFEDFTIIHYNLTQTTAQVRLRVFDSRGRLVRTILNNQASGSTGAIIFDGKNDEGNPLRIGIYILFLEALNSSTGVVDTIKEVVVIARRL